MELGHRQVDAEHRAMMVHLNQLVDAVFGVTQDGDGIHSGVGRLARIEAAIEALRRATVAHFSSEEALMASSSFPGMSVHADQHEELLDQLAKFAEQLHNNQAESLPHAVRFVREWFEFHVENYDRALVRWVNASEDNAGNSADASADN